ncbi:DUF937 domain-containing protein [Granulosicoccus sp. 3-233]|uniref:DUF937 domain-containing protein n=1 Tax=Granulosicoccus sp. 3-233 TaxID=3417969 RepID=UPI003D326AB2
MSNLLDVLFADENKAAMDEVQKNFNLSEQETRAAVEELIPALSRGLQKNTEATPGMDELLEALRTGKHERYMEKPGTLGAPETIKDGNDILGHIFGSKEVSREVATRASGKSGLSSSLLKKMLPVVASLAMGALSKQVLGSSGRTKTTRAGTGGLLSSLLDSDKDGSIWDDVLGMAARTLLR